MKHFILSFRTLIIFCGCFLLTASLAKAEFDGVYAGEASSILKEDEEAFGFVPNYCAYGTCSVIAYYAAIAECSKVPANSRELCIGRTFYSSDFNCWDQLESPTIKTPEISSCFDCSFGKCMHAGGIACEAGFLGSETYYLCLANQARYCLKQSSIECG